MRKASNKFEDKVGKLSDKCHNLAPIFRLLITMSASPMARAATSGQDIPTR